MLRHDSPVERVLTYATFFAISLAIHMVVILGDRKVPERSEAPPPAVETPRGGPR